MDFSWNDEQLMLRNTIIEFSKNELNENMVERDKKGEFSWDGWKKCAEIGLLGLPVPEEYGGNSADILTTILALESLGYGCKDNGLITAINAQISGCEEPIWRFGNESQKNKYLPKLCTGEFVGGHAMTEPDAGSDAFSIQTKAVKRGDKYILNGNKIFITNGPIADVVVVFAFTDKTQGWGGMSAFIIEKGFPGFTVSRELDKMGIKTSPTGELAFDECEVPVENLLGQEGMGMAIFNSSMEWERSCLFASHLGVMERQLDICIQYAQQRQQFGQPIGKFQSISNKIADMKSRIELSKLILYKTGWMKSQGKR